MENNCTLHDLKGSISLRAREMGSGIRLLFDDDEESYFDLNLEKMADSEEFEFHLASVSSLHSTSEELPTQQQTADELFRNGNFLTLQETETRNPQQLASRHGDPQQVHPAEMLPLQENTTLADGVSDNGGAKRKVQVELQGYLKKTHGVPDRFRQYKMEEKQQQQTPAGTRDASTGTTAKKSSSRVMRFLVNFPSERIRSTFMSILKLHHLRSVQHKRVGEGGLSQEQAGRKHKVLLMDFSRWLQAIIWKKGSSHNKSGRNSGAASPRPSNMDLDEDVVRNILEAVNFAVAGRRTTGGNLASSDISRRPSHPSLPHCPRTVPWKEARGGVMERHSSISSAIAHCKVSYESKSS